MSKNTFMTTISGKEIYWHDPNPDEIIIEDIAWHLSFICRFVGACKRFYSVAEHSILGSQYLNPEFKLEFLLHDAHEAYTNDLPPGLKFEEYREVQNNIDFIIRAKFGLPLTMRPEVKEMDYRCQKTEKLYLMPPVPDRPNLVNLEPLPHKLSLHNSMAGADPGDFSAIRNKFLSLFKVYTEA